MNETAPLTDAEKRTRVFFASTAFVPLSVIIIALVYLATSTTTAATATLSFAGGVSNIFLPCTLPLAFVIVPMSMGMDYRKGLTMALVFGLGLIITLAFYGAAAAMSLSSVSVIGNALRLNRGVRMSPASRYRHGADGPPVQSDPVIATPEFPPPHIGALTAFSRPSVPFNPVLPRRSRMPAAPRPAGHLVPGPRSW